MASILTRHVTHWACLGCSGPAYTTVPANTQQLHTAIEEEWTNIPQSTTWSTQCEGDALHCVRQMVITPDTDKLSDPPRPPNTVKLHILDWSFIVSSLRHTCAIIMLSNQHLDMPHLWGGWIISAKEKCLYIFSFILQVFIVLLSFLVGVFYSFVFQFYYFSTFLVILVYQVTLN